MGSYAEHAKNCISTLDEEFERRIQVLREEHAEEVREMEAKLVSLEERYEQNLEKTLERMRQMHEHEINKTAEMVRLQCSKEYERQIQELHEEIQRQQKSIESCEASSPVKCVDTSNGYDRLNILELIDLVKQGLENKPAGIDHNRVFDRINGYHRAFLYGRRSPNRDHFQSLVCLCRRSNWFSANQNARFDFWCQRYNWQSTEGTDH
jgi:hypothetical protein